MNSPDVNVLVFAHREGSERHEVCRNWLLQQIEDKSSLAISELVLAGFYRIVTNRKIFKPASSIEQALAFIEQLLQVKPVICIRPSVKSFDLYTQLLTKHQITGKMSADAYHAAIAIEHNLTWVTCDSDFSRFSDELKVQLL